MVLDLIEIASIIKNRPNKNVLDAGVALNKKLRMHVYGECLDASLPMVDGYERSTLHATRAKYARSNIDLFERLGRPIDKVFTAGGGSTYYHMTEEQDKRARSVLSALPDGESVRTWMGSFWRDYMATDPYGVMMVELMPDQDSARRAFNADQALAFPTYIATHRIHDYKTKGVNLEYIILLLSPDEKVQYGVNDQLTAYRLIDDEKDAIVIVEGDVTGMPEDLLLPNLVGYVPGRVMSSLRDSSKDVGFLSIYSKVIELADHFLLKGSIRLTHDFMHGFPKYYEYADDCITCAGTSWNGNKPCEVCGGTGRKAMTKVSDVKLLAFPKKDELGGQDLIVTPNVAGYISPDQTYYEISTSDIQLLEDLMSITLWGTQSRVRAQGLAISGDGTTKTATEVIDELKPQQDRLSLVSSMGEAMEKFISDTIIRYQIRPNYAGGSYNYGRRFILENPDVIFNKYTAARKEGVSVEILNALLLEYIESSYVNDPIRKMVAVKLKDVEPFVHNTFAEIKEWPISDLDKMRKAFFIDWRNQVPPQQFVILTVDELNASLLEYVTAKAEGKGKDTTPLAVRWGVGGTQSYFEMVANQAISNDMKLLFSVNMFGVPEDVAKSIFENAPALPPPASMN